MNDPCIFLQMSAAEHAARAIAEVSPLAGLPAGFAGDGLPVSVRAQNLLRGGHVQAGPAGDAAYALATVSTEHPRSDFQCIGPTDSDIFRAKLGGGFCLLSTNAGLAGVYRESEDWYSDRPLSNR